MNKVKTDCVKFPLDRPCGLQKEKGVKCPGCKDYVPFFSPTAETRILIIKLGAMGDVLRTTFLLSGLKEKYPRAAITWIVGPSSVGILENNPYLDRVIPFDHKVLSLLVRERFTVSINLDLAPESLALATLANADKKIGYWLDAKRKIAYSNTHAEEWLQMSAFDDIKKQNTRTYQWWMSKIAGLARQDYEIYTPLLKKSIGRANIFARANRLNNKLVVGINPGAGKRWKLKKWTDRGYLAIIRKLEAKGCKVLLLGGPEEESLIAKLVRQSNGAAVSAGTNNSLPDFFALINLCDVVLTGDTLALHASLGLKKKVAVVFGPTSSAEIELYGRGRKIISPAPCVCCYRPSCDVRPDCMKQVSTETVWSVLEQLINEVA